jgi:hypothetical protein
MRRVSRKQTSRLRSLPRQHPLLLPSLHNLRGIGSNRMRHRAGAVLNQYSRNRNKLRLLHKHRT